MKKITILALLILIGGSLVFAGGSEEVKSVTTGTVARQGKTVYVGLSENLISLDPLDQANIIGNMQANLVCEPLVWYNDDDGSYSPLLAESWDVSADGLTWRFYLRKGVKFHNGEDFTSADCAITYQRVLDNKKTLRGPLSYWAELDSYKVIDDYTFEIKMASPYATVLMSVWMTPILPDQEFGKYGTKLWTEHKLIGTGPWMFQEWVDGQYCAYNKNTNYWNKANYDSYYDKLVLRYITEPSTLVASHLTGDINVNIASGGINPDMLQLYKGSDDKIQMISFPSGTYLYIGFSYKDGSPFRDENVRAAFNYAIDRQAIVKNILGGGKVPNSIIVEPCIGFNPDVPVFEYNPTKAEELLKKSSYKGQRIELTCNTSTIKGEAILLAVSEMLNKVGFNTYVSVVEVATLANVRATGDYDAFMVTNMHLANDPGTCLTFRILNDGHTSFYKDDKLLDLIKKSNVEVDVEKRTNLLKEVALEMNKQHGPHTPIAQVQLNYAADKGIYGMELYASGWFNIKHINFDPNL